MTPDTVQPVAHRYGLQNRAGAILVERDIIEVVR